MAIEKLASVAGQQATQALKGSRTSFAKTLEQVKTAAKPPEPRVQSPAPANVNAAAGAKVAAAGKVLDQVSAAQARLDKLLALAQSGKTFSPAELLALQVQACSASQQLDLAGKLVEKATGGVKQVLQTQV